MSCPCGTGIEFESCCGPFISGAQLPPTAERLMRSRYTAYVRADLPYIQKTMATEVLKSAQQVKWQGLRILSTDHGTAEDDRGVVEFIATYEHDGEAIEHHETSQFRKDKSGQWLFVSGEVETGGKAGAAAAGPIVRAEAKVGRNDPCPCGSGKKYKKCCG
jgi:SEC-C motif-containing protein